MQVAVESAAFKASLKPELTLELGRLVRSMNCYYSNLIEGHHTHPVAIELALAGNYDQQPEERNLQLEARAHIEVQELIDREFAPEPVVSEMFLRWLHAEFCGRLPEELLVVTDPKTGKSTVVEPGAFREVDVVVGKHLAPSPSLLPELMDRFVRSYDIEHFTGTAKVLRAAAAHHRLLWVHPFLDGNGRVARLFSHAMLREVGVGSELWSISRGFARNVRAYKDRLEEADEMRQGDLDGRGNLSEQALANFCAFFLEVCLDQIRFMRSLLDPEQLLVRVMLWVDEEIASGRLPQGSRELLGRVILEGSIERGAASYITGYQERQARTVLKALLDRQCLVSDTERGPVRLAFATDILERWLPLLYPSS